jgi:hypothetical protein
LHQDSLSRRSVGDPGVWAEDRGAKSKRLVGPAVARHEFCSDEQQVTQPPPTERGREPVLGRRRAVSPVIALTPKEHPDRPMSEWSKMG